VVFVSSESALNVPVEMIHYGMTQAAQVAIAAGLAKDRAGSGVTVNSILPGPTWSEGVQAFLGRLARERLFPPDRRPRARRPINEIGIHFRLTAGTAAGYSRHAMLNMHFSFI
jgi:NAD(P)-dependent dehydrogenase (short-subunit alcohol dehydrogenase family)